MTVENTYNTADLANNALSDLATKGAAVLAALEALDTTNVYLAQRNAFETAYNAYINPDLA